MLRIDNYLRAESLAEAHQTLLAEPASVILGGCGYLRLGDRRIGTAIDLSGLGLDYIRDGGDDIEIGAMTTLRAIETHLLTTSLFDGVLAASVRDIVGVQLRNVVTLGGTVAGKYPFSDPLTALSALKTRVVLFTQGEMALADYLAGSAHKDIVVQVRIRKDDRRAAFASMRRTRTDYAVLNCAVSAMAADYRIVVGARPGRATLATEAMDYLAAHGLDDTTAARAGEIAAASLKFGDNPRGSARYRQAICPVLVRRALMEVNHAD